MVQIPNRKYPIITRCLCLLIIYDLYSRNFSVIPDFVKENRKEVLDFLKNAADRNSSVNLPYAIIDSTSDIGTSETQVDQSWNYPNNQNPFLLGNYQNNSFGRW